MATKENELATKLKKQMIAIVCLVLFGILGVVFAPKVAFVLSLISKDHGKQVEIKHIAQAPTLIDTPEATSSSKITVRGSAEPNSNVKLFVNGPEKGTSLADTEGAFLFTDIELIEGSNSFFVKTSQDNGSDEIRSEIIRIVYDKTKPKIELETPKKDETVKNLNKRILVKGKTSEECTVTINGKSAIVKPDYSFELLMGVEEGKVRIKVEAMDKAGNKEEKEISVTYQKS